MIKTLFVILLLGGASLSVYATENSIENDLNNYFNNLGFKTNVTSGKAYQGQSAGYYSGGSLFARTSVRNLSPIELTLPSYRSGCSGIDVYMGGLSFIKGDEIIKMAKAVLNDAQGYAFDLALESLTPEIANVMKNLRDLANKVNQANINSCETAAGLVGGFWPKSREAQQQICRDVGTTSNIFTDWVQARQGCGKQDQMNRVYQANADDPRFKDMLMNDVNLVWKALSQNSFYSNNIKTAELLMSLSGTIIMNKKDNPNQDSDKSSVNRFAVYPSLLNNGELIDKLLHGGDVAIYSCDESKSCLNIKNEVIHIDEAYALQTRVKKILEDIVNKIYSENTQSPSSLDNNSLSDEEKGFINSTRMPVYKMLNVQAAFNKNNGFFDVSEYADIIAIDILFRYLNDNLTFVTTAANMLQCPPEYIEQFESSVQAARHNLEVKEENAYRQVSISLQLIQQTQTIEQMLAGQLSSQLANTLSWAQGLNRS